MFERFTDRNRRVVVLAQEFARLLQHNYIGTEHLLLGLLDEGESTAAQVLKEIGLETYEVQKKIVELVGEGTQPPQGHIPFTPASKKVLELGLREALQMGHNYIAPEHLLLAMVGDRYFVEGNLAVQVLAAFDVTPGEVRQTVTRRVHQYDRDERQRNDPYLTTEAAKPLSVYAGVWMVFNADGSMARPFATEIEALRCAVGLAGSQVEFTKWGQDVGRAEAAS